MTVLFALVAPLMVLVALLSEVELVKKHQHQYSLQLNVKIKSADLIN